MAHEQQGEIDRFIYPGGIITVLRGAEGDVRMPEWEKQEQHSASRTTSGKQRKNPRT